MSLGVIPRDARVAVEVTRDRLANGIEVVVHTDRATAFAAITMSFDGGAASDPPGRSGLAHIAEHAVVDAVDAAVRATESPPVFVDTTQRSAATTWRSISYRTLVPAEELPFALWIEAERLAAAADGVHVWAAGAARGVVVELEQRRTADPVSSEIPWRVVRRLRGAADGAARPFGGIVSDVERVTAAETAAGARRLHDPRRAVLAISSPWPRDDVLAWSAAYLHAFPPRPADAAWRRTDSDGGVDGGGADNGVVQLNVSAPQTHVAIELPAVATSRFGAVSVFSELLRASVGSVLRRPSAQGVRVRPMAISNDTLVVVASVAVGSLGAFAEAQQAVTTALEQMAARNTGPRDTDLAVRTASAADLRQFSSLSSRPGLLVDAARYSWLDGGVLLWEGIDAGEAAALAEGSLGRGLAVLSVVPSGRP